LCVVADKEEEEEEENGDSTRATHMGDREEEQLFLGEGVWKQHSECSIQQRE